MGESIRLQKILAQAGCGSRRACEVFITDGRVTVDSVIVRQLGSKADPETQTIELDGNKVAGPGKLAKGVKASGEHVYWMLNKPKGVLCTNEDPSGRPLAVQMVPERRRVFCVGRLDKDTEGLILLTNDGELTNQLTHPRYGVEKVYVARVDGRALPQQIAKLQRGVHLAEGKTQGARVRLRKSAGSQSILELCISEGMNRQVRRMLAAVGLYVRGLKRISVGPVRLGEIGPGESRQLTGDEVDRLRAAIRNAQKEAEAPSKIVERDADEDADEDHDEDRIVPQKKAKKEKDREKAPVEKRKRRDAEFKAKQEKSDEDAPAKRRKTWPSETTQEELEELEDLDEAVGTRTAMAPVDDENSTTQEAPPVSDVAGDATQAARAIDKELEGDDSDEDESEFGGVEMDDDELSEAETAPQQPILDEVGDEDNDEDGDDEDGLIIKRKKNLNAAAALDEDADTTELVEGIDDDEDEDEEDDEPFDAASPMAGKGDKKWVDRGDIDDPRLNAAAADKAHKEEERENRKRQQSAAREGSAAGKPRSNSRGGDRGEKFGKGGRNFKSRDDRPYQPRGKGGPGGDKGDRGDRGPRQYGDRPNRGGASGGSGGGDRDRSEHYRPRSGPKFSGPRRDSPAFDKRKTWGEVSSGGAGRPERSEGGGERRYEKREGGRPDWKKSGPRDGERKPYGDRKPYSGGAGGGDRGPRPQNREGGNWRDKREGGAPRGDRPYQKKSYGDRPQGGGQGRPYGGGQGRSGGQSRPYSGGSGGGRPDRGGQDRRGPRPEWRGSSSGGPGGRKPDSRGGDRPRTPRPDGEKRSFSPRPWENKSRGGSGGGGRSGGGDRGGSGQRQSRPWEKREPRGGGEGGDE